MNITKFVSHRNWFDLIDTEVAIRHRAAYADSLRTKRIIRVSKDNYYYRGFSISRCGVPRFRWRYGIPSVIHFNYSKSKREAIRYIDDIVDDISSR